MIIRSVVIKDASTVGTACACTGAGAGTVVDLGARGPDVTALRAGLHVLSSGANGIKAWVQANSSSGYTALNTGTDVAAFSSQSCRGSQWAEVGWNCASATSTDRRYWRAAWTQTCTDTDKWLLGISVG